MVVCKQWVWGCPSVKQTRMVRDIHDFNLPILTPKLPPTGASFNPYTFLSNMFEQLSLVFFVPTPLQAIK